MARLFHVSIPDTEKDLLKWIEDREKDREFSPTIIFQDAIKERKREWDIAHSENPAHLHQRIDMLKITLGQFNQFIQEKKLQEIWFEFKEKLDNANTNIKDLKGGAEE